MGLLTSLCLSCMCLLAVHTLFCVIFSLPPGVGGWLRLLLVALPGRFCLPFCINNNKYLNCSFVDFTKVFDYVEMDILWYKLIKIKVRGQILNIIRSINYSVKSRVKIITLSAKLTHVI